MKHLFWVHSHTSFYTSLAAIEYLKLNIDDVLFLSDRGYINKYFDYDFHDLSGLVNKLSPFTIKTAVSLRNIQREFDIEINKIIDENSFISYVPHLAHPAYQILITHHKSSGFNFVEEGLANYINENYHGATFRNFSTLVNSLIHIYNHFNDRVILGHEIFGRYRKFNFEPKYFLIDNKYHTKRENQIRLTWKPHKVEIEVLKKSAILILGPTLEYHMANLNYYKEALQKLLDYSLVNGFSCFYIKYHPYNNKNTMLLVEALLRKNEIKFRIIPHNEPIEQMLRNDHDLTVLGIDSSLLFYAKLLNKGNRVISAYKHLLVNDDVYQQRCSLRKIETIFEDSIVIL